MENRTLLLSALGIAIVSYTIGYRQGVKSMVVNWQKTVAPAFSGYLAAKDAVHEYMNTQYLEDDED